MQNKFGIVGVCTSIKEIVSKDKNPFLEEIIVSKKLTIKRFKKGEAVMNDKVKDFDRIQELTEENKQLWKEDLTIATVKKKQSSPFIFLYTDIDLKDYYKDLSAGTLKALFYILYKKISFGSDVIIINANELSKKLDMSINTSYNVFVELYNCKLLDKRAENVWWINPNYFYTGDRLNIKTK